MENSSFDKLIFKSSALLGICPFETNGTEKVALSKIYMWCVLLIMIICVLLSGGYELLTDIAGFTVIEKLLLGSGTIILLVLYMVILFSNSNYYSKWQIMYHNIENLNNISIRSGKTAFKLNKCLLCLMQYDKRNNNNARIKKKSSKLEIFMDSLKCVVIHLTIPCIAILDNRFWSNNEDFSFATALKSLYQYFGMHYELLLTIFFWRNVNILIRKYQYLKTVLENIFEDEFGDFMYLKDIKKFYKLLFQTVDCLSTVFGLTILIIITDSIIRFLVNIVWGFYISNLPYSHLNIEGTFIFGIICLVSMGIDFLYNIQNLFSLILNIINSCFIRNHRVSFGN